MDLRDVRDCLLHVEALPALLGPVSIRRVSIDDTADTAVRRISKQASVGAASYDTHRQAS